ncbi:MULTISPECIES: Sec-independent protein translocase protein TatB [Pseudomonas]|jgi:sec-independent protein translocase protein TatB|uniref:Sec-independent protein translocase TatB n=1 Tax=Pseudomonas putida TaxID=303 RepID=A0A9X8EJC2_PSEPU|nr:MULTISPECIES: Sec-independent protein translocase protein TatB [Pseudomonas]KTC20885.1 preprotein translocase subunit TatA [Pseudomonas putida]MBG8558499.1 twin-arginine translocase subunit TatB [Pseudomonas qingdaonensis]MCO7505300.1 Sec-independent protein translocase protein TatB [Pseudomonas sp. VE 267-6A]MCO7528832.1 Sec-independent protein translocase protein TatB [Pseudomonas sp. 2]MCP8351264.1 twin-arginine translocase subunit TatB [Pseudomonas sp. FBF18]
MFEIGFTELLLVGVVALLVLGPERLPVAMRTVGRGVGQARRAMGALRAQVERELDTQALTQELDAEPLRRLEQELRQGVSLQAQPTPTSTNGPCP